MASKLNTEMKALANIHFLVSPYVRFPPVVLAIKSCAFKDLSFRSFSLGSFFMITSDIMVSYKLYSDAKVMSWQSGIRA